MKPIIFERIVSEVPGDHTQGLYHTRDPYEGADWLLVSAIELVGGYTETAVFQSSEAGFPTAWNKELVKLTRTYDHRKALEALGYDAEYTPTDTLTESDK